MLAILACLDVNDIVEKDCRSLIHCENQQLKKKGKIQIESKTDTQYIHTYNPFTVLVTMETTQTIPATIETPIEDVVFK